ncbi:MAG: spondin domain-containing protein [Planctomycetota bacterium]
MKAPSTLSSLPLVALLATGAFAQGAEAVYDVTFDSTWSPATHPSAWPGPSAHYSPLIGATHSDAISFWEPGGIATNGIEVMAETGGTFALTNEINAQIGAGTAGEIITGAGIDSPDTTTSSFRLTDGHSQVTLVTMIAPSPDWFVGVHGLELFQNGSWVDQITVDLFAYDAGTDSGLSFTSGNQNTFPQEPISLMTSGPFFGTTPLGTFTFTRVESVEPFGCGTNPDGSLTFNGTPSIGQTLPFSIDDPLGTFGTPSSTFLAVGTQPVPLSPCGPLVPGLGFGPIGSTGELLVNPALTVTGSQWSGSPVQVDLDVPSLPSLVSATVYVQGALVDPALQIGLTQGYELTIGL